MVPLAPLDQQQKISDTVESMTSLGTKIQKSLVIRSLVVTALADSMLSGNV
jgi:restriction endonuclease S subunit